MNQAPQRPVFSPLQRLTLLRKFVIVAGLICTAASSGFAADWPQVLGPRRDGQAVQESVRPWQGELAVQWSYDCGAGYAGVAVANDRVLVWHREESREFLDCLKTQDGSRIWRQSFEAYYRGGVDPDTGPRCVPVVVGDTVIVYGAGGDLHAVALADGKTKWSRGMKADHDADEGYFGAGSTPLVITNDELTETGSSAENATGGLVITEVGGRRGAGLVAVELTTGKTRWSTLDSEAAYASPVKIMLDGKLYIAALMRLSLAIVEPKTGKVQQEIPFGRRGPTVNAATPLIDGQQVFLTASYGIGCKMLKLTSKGFESLWKDSEVISSQYVTPVKVGDFLYAITGREDMGVPGLCCVEWKTGRQRWIKPNYGTAHLIAIGDQVLAQNVDGKLDLIAATPDSLKLLSCSSLPEGTYRSLPALSDGVLYARRSETPQSGQVLAIKLPSGQP